MKNILFLTVLFTNICIYSQQETQTEIGRNELKINAGTLLAGMPEITYEHILNSESALGISLAFSADSAIDINFMAVPYYRIYFGTKEAAGFFIEGNGAIISDNINNWETEITGETGDKTGLGLGLAIGNKYMTKSGWIGEFTLGIIRNFVNTEYINDAYGRVGLTIGKRF